MKFCKKKKKVISFRCSLMIFRKDKITRIIVKLMTCSISKLKLADQRYFYCQLNRSIQGHAIILNPLSQKNLSLQSSEHCLSSLVPKPQYDQNQPWPPSTLIFGSGYSQMCKGTSPSILSVTEYTAILPRHI